MGELRLGGVIDPPSLRGAKRPSNPFFVRRKMDCFASLAMTGMKAAPTLPPHQEGLRKPGQASLAPVAGILRMRFPATI